MTGNGAVLVDKAAGWTSHDVVAKLRGLLRERRIGHAGTLDPMATGLLVLAVGPSTRLLRFATAGTKTYEGRVRFGVATDTLDATGTVVATSAVPPLTPTLVSTAAASLLGPGTQIPPMVSAIKVGGKKLYELARAGEEVERAPRPVVITSFELAPTDDRDEWTFRTVTSPGTYVRTLAADLATRLGTIGHLTALRRVASGRNHVDDAYTLDGLAERLAAGDDVLQPARSLVDHLPAVVLDEQRERDARHGKALEGGEVGEVVLSRADGLVIGVATGNGGVLRPTLILPTSEPGDRR
jgi:tRNA pseudouridine55 synthase